MMDLKKMMKALKALTPTKSGNVKLEPNRQYEKMLKLK